MRETRTANGRVSSFAVAQLAGVSRSAVSRTFTDGASVSDATRAKVVKAARELGYMPNAIARTLITRRSRIVGIVMADLTNPFYSQALACLSESLRQRDLLPLLVAAQHEKHVDDMVLKLLAYQVEGVIIASATLSSTAAEYCVAAGVPVIHFNRYTDSPSVSAVYCDNEGAGLLAGNLLLDAGFTRIGFIAGIEDTSSSSDRERGLRAALEKRGLSVFCREVGEYSYEGGKQAARLMLGAGNRPEAIFCANDMMALGLVDVAVGEFALEVPKSLSVIGFDNIPAASFERYALTTIDQNVEAMANETVQLFADIQSSHMYQPQRKIVSCRLVERRSVVPGQNLAQ